MRASTKRIHNQQVLDYDVSAHLWRINWKANGYPFCGVYVISTDSRYPCKIGISANPTKRLTSLQTSHWRPLQISGYRYCENSSDAKKIEREVHNILTENGKALLGEWFDVRPEKALEAMEWAALSLGVALMSDIPDENVEKAIWSALDCMSVKGLTRGWTQAT